MAKRCHPFVSRSFIIASDSERNFAMAVSSLFVRMRSNLRLPSPPNSNLRSSIQAESSPPHSRMNSSVLASAAEPKARVLICSRSWRPSPSLPRAAFISACMRMMSEKRMYGLLIPLWRCFTVHGFVMRFSSHLLLAMPPLRREPLAKLSIPSEPLPLEPVTAHVTSRRRSLGSKSP